MPARIAARRWSEKLLKAGANPNATLLRGQTVLMECARTGDVRAVTALLAAGAQVNAKESINDQTALMWAVAQQHPRVVEALIELGADIRARSRTYPQNVQTGNRGWRRRGLFCVPGRKHAAAVCGASGRRGVREAPPRGRRRRERQRCRMGRPLWSLRLTAVMESSALCCWRRAPTRTPTEVGYTALHAAVDRSDLALVKALLAHGANPERAHHQRLLRRRRDSNDFQLPSRLIGSTAYLLAAKFVEVEIMRALAAAGADPKAVMPDGTTALMLAAGNGESRARDERRNETRRQICVCDWGVMEDESVVLDAVTVAVNLGSDVNAVEQGRRNGPA